MKTEKMTKLYLENKAAKNKTECTCPTCGKGFTKKSYQQTFCSNKGANNCKDRYWNAVSPSRNDWVNRLSDDEVFSDHTHPFDLESGW